VRLLRAVAPLVALLALAGCADDPAPAADAPEPTPSIRTLEPIVLPPPPPPSGRLLAQMRQSSLDASRRQMQVWIDNDTAGEVTPLRIRYDDARLGGSVDAQRLRPIPSRAKRGFVIPLPERPACGADEPGPRLRVSAGGRTRTLRVEDETDVVGRYTAARCLELAVARVAVLRWADEVPAEGAGGAGDDGTLTLLVEPTGTDGPELVIETVSGTTLLAPVGTDAWRPGATVRGTDAPSRIDLPLKPNRCDDHAFLEGGGSTAFKIALTLDGEPGMFTLRMSTAGAKNAIDFARRACGMLSTVSGGS
jgi:hypothetical protein